MRLILVCTIQHWGCNDISKSHTWVKKKKVPQVTHVNVTRRAFKRIASGLRLFRLFPFFPQRDWVNEYHRKCREVVGAELERQGRKEALEWLTRETQPIA